MKTLNYLAMIFAVLLTACTKEADILQPMKPKNSIPGIQVEVRNGMLFFKPDQIIKEPVTVKIPEIDRKKCIGCRKCIDFCKFNALAYIRKNVLVFEEFSFFHQ